MQTDFPSSAPCRRRCPRCRDEAPESGLSGIWFYEFLANWQQPAYQSLWALFVEMAGAEDADPARLRQYLALLANPPLQKAVFGV